MYYKKGGSLQIYLYMLMIVFMVLFIYLDVHMISKIYYLEYELLEISGLTMKFIILLDWVSSVFISVVLLISLVIFLYSQYYVGSEDYVFMIMLFMFVLSMIILVVSPNLISLLLGWDGLGLTSYGLVIYYYSVSSNNAGMLTVMTNRIGDTLMLVSIGWSLNFMSWDLFFYENLMLNTLSNIGLMLMGMIMVACMTKSAQIPFSSWLPAAMAAPTPVSALVHSSTLVTAGVYLMIRFNYMFNNYYLKKLMILLSVVTMFMSGLSAVYECDLKKVIALSTLSQLGLMISILSLGYWKLCFFHLTTHALFKSLMFMCAGYVIYMSGDNQDIRCLGGMSNMYKLGCYFNTAVMGLCGLPFLSGFYSKDYILDFVFFGNNNMLIVIMYFMSIFFTVVYSFRLIYCLIFSSSGSLVYHGASGSIMLKYMVLIWLCVIICGSLFMWEMYGYMPIFNLPMYMKLLVFFIFILGGFMGVKMNYIQKHFVKKLYAMLGFFLSILGLCRLSFLFKVFYLKVGSGLDKLLEQGWMEFFGAQGIYYLMFSISEVIMAYNQKNLFIVMYSFMLMVLMFNYIYLDS
nr:NADH dehydrogenase subunit 5 [Asiopsocus sonorensis]